MIARLFEAGADVFRINMSHTSHDAMRKLHGTIRAVEKEYGRPIGILADLQGPKLRVGTFTGDFVMLKKGETFTLDSDKTPGDEHRVYLPHPEILAALGARPQAPARRWQGEPDRTRDLAQARGHARRGRRQALGAQGREPARHHHRVLGADRQGPLRSRSLPEHRRRLDRAFLHPAAGGHRRGEEDHARPRHRDGQDREAAGGRAARRDPRFHRRPDGRARRPRRGDAAGKSARHPEADDARGARRGQAGGRRDADAGVDDHQSGADARRGVRCRDRDLRGRRRRDALGRDAPPGNIRSRRSPR